MKTQQITRGAMVCAIYGVLLFLNQQTALTIETTASWIFVFPVLIYTAMNGFQPGLTVALCMGVMSFLFGGFTTWFYSWTSLITGFVYGLGLFYHFRNMVNFLLCFGFSIASNVCTVLVWAALFGIDAASEFAELKALLPFVDMQVIILISIVGLAFLQALCIHLVSIMVCMRMHIPYEPLTPLTSIKSSKKVGILSLFIWLFFLLFENVVECSKGLQSFMQLIWILDCIVLILFGTIYLLHICALHNKKRFFFFVLLGAFIPMVNIVWMIIGEIDCLFQLRRTYLE